MNGKKNKGIDIGNIQAFVPDIIDKFIENLKDAAKEECILFAVNLLQQAVPDRHALSAAELLEYVEREYAKWKSHVG